MLQIFTLDYNEHWYAKLWAKRLIFGDDHSFFRSSKLGKTFSKNRVKRKQKEQVLLQPIVTFVLFMKLVENHENGE